MKISHLILFFIGLCGYGISINILSLTYIEHMSPVVGNDKAFWHGLELFFVVYFSSAMMFYYLFKLTSKDRH